MNPDVQYSGRHTFPAREKLKHRTSIQNLFDKGKHLVIPPLRVIYVFTDESNLPRFSVSVPKKYFSKAVDRNRIKRKIREHYRMQKHGLLEFCSTKSIGIDMMWVYSSKTILENEAWSQTMAQLMERLVLLIHKKYGNPTA